jgi:hypothetical protein
MPNRMLLIALAVTSLALATLSACGATYNPNDLYGTPLPTATPTPVTTPNPNLSAAPVTVTVGGEPVANQPVSMYSDISGHIGSLILTQDTSSTGQTTFSNLTPSTGYCFTSTYTPAVAGSTQQKQTFCTNLWGFGIDFAF